MSTDLALLQQYARTRDADAFAELVHRYADMVYATCLRITANAHDAEDAAQESFLELARRARSVVTSVPGWLHTTATSRALNAIRDGATRRRHEATAHPQQRDHAEATWQEIVPYVDQAIEELPEELRLPLVEHYLQRRRQTEIAAELGLDQSTVSRRIEKGLAALRRKLRKAGIAAPAGLVGVLLTEKTACAAPATLSAALAKMAMAGIGAKAAGVALGALGVKLGAGVAAGILIVCGAAGYTQYARKPPQSAARKASALPAPKTPEEWAKQRGWEARPVERTTLITEGLQKMFGNWRNLPFEIDAAEEADARKLIAVARDMHTTHIIDDAVRFNSIETRHEIERVLRGRPSYFYAEFLLGVWHRNHGALDKSRRLCERAFAHAPRVIVLRYRRRGGQPLAGVKVRIFALECNRVKKGYLDPSLTLKYPLLVTDEAGCIYLPVYNTVYRTNWMASPEGDRAEYTSMGWFESPAKVGLLPATDVTVTKTPAEAERAFVKAMEAERLPYTRRKDKIKDWWAYLQNYAGTGHKAAAARERLAYWKSLKLPVHTAPEQSFATVRLQRGELPPRFAAFSVPTSRVDQRGNPVVRRNGRTFDPGTGCPYELWLRDPQMEFVLITPGGFTMGGVEPYSRDDGERPTHLVRITMPFYMGKYEVTNAQFRCFRSGYAAKPYRGRLLDGDSQPATYLTWHDATAMCEWLSGRAQVEMRLPTEAEWEYACRAGTQTRFYWGDDESTACQYGNFGDQRYAGDEAKKRELLGLGRLFDCDDGYATASPVGSFQPNGFGLYDMLGNVTEWCLDGMRSYWPTAATDPRGPDTLWRTRRGGSWVSGPSTNCAQRSSGRPSRAWYSIGLRVCWW